jgi:hypothetical protein
MAHYEGVKFAAMNTSGAEGSDAMKTYRSTAELLEEIEAVFASNRPCANPSPLDEVVGLLREGRHYGWAGIYVAVDRAAEKPDGAQPGQVALAETRSKILVSLKLSGREYGILAVESERLKFRPHDRVFLEQVADLGARFLAGPGRYLGRKARRTAVSERSQAAVA